MRAVVLCLLAIGAFAATGVARGEQWIAGTPEDISPKQADQSGNVAGNIPQRATGGRVNGLARSGGTYYAASEWGGLFKTADGGGHWAPVPAHLPQATWDVEVDPSDPNRIYATSFFDGLAASKGAISVSDDGGAQWSKPGTSLPLEHFCLLDRPNARDVRRLEPSAFGIAIDPDSTNVVYVGTNCGLAKSTDKGETWRYIDTTPSVGSAAADADDVWDVVVHHGHVVDVCGNDGHQRSLDGGATWSASHLPTAGRCSIAASPHEKNVLFVAVGLTLYESDDGGASWPAAFTNGTPDPTAKPDRQGRIPFVATNARIGPDFDLYYGNKDLFRVSCRTPPASTVAVATGRRCDPAGASVKVQQGAHQDVGDVAFAANGCPALFASDGGVYRNTKTSPSDCHAPVWAQAAETTRALWTWALTGAKNGTKQELYFGAQDNGFFATQDARASTVTWRALDCCDVYDAAADGDQALYTRCCRETAIRWNLVVLRPSPTAPWTEFDENDYPKGLSANDIAAIPKGSDGTVIASFAKDSYAVLTNKGVFYTTNIDAHPPTWSMLGAWPTTLAPVDIKVAHDAAGEPTFYVLAAKAGYLLNSAIRGPASRPNNFNAMFTHVRLGAGAWVEKTVPGGFRIGLLAVDPNDPDRLIAAHAKADFEGSDPPAEAKMMRSSDGGQTWDAMTALDGMMTGSGPRRRAYANGRGITRSTWFRGYAQPTLVKFDPLNAKLIVAGGADAGVFFSFDDGATWRRIAPGDKIPRPRFAYFDHETADKINLYIGSQGRGVWRVVLKRTP